MLTFHCDFVLSSAWMGEEIHLNGYFSYWVLIAWLVCFDKNYANIMK